MIDVEKACEIATQERHEPFVNVITDIGRGYVIGTMNEDGETADLPPVFVDKETGKSESFFIPLHFAEIHKGTKVQVPSKFNR